MSDIKCIHALEVSVHSECDPTQNIMELFDLENLEITFTECSDVLHQY